MVYSAGATSATDKYLQQWPLAVISSLCVWLALFIGIASAGACAHLAFVIERLEARRGASMAGRMPGVLRLSPRSIALKSCESA